MNFTELFAGEKPVLSFEFFPPKKQELLDSTKQQISRLSSYHPDFMTVTYGAGGGTRELTRDLVRYIHQELQLPAVAHLTCVGHSKDDIDGVLDSLAEVGISNILALRGDPPKGETSFQPHADGFANARDLTKHIAAKDNFHIAVAGYPETHLEAKSPEDDIRYLKEKVDAGAEIIITQLFFDADMYFSFCDRAVSAGISVPIVPGVMPIRNVSQLKRFTGMCGATIPESVSADLEKIESDDAAVRAYGIDFAVSLCETLLDGGAPGLHLYTLNQSKQIGPIVERLESRLTV